MSVSFRELLRRLPGLRLAVPAEQVHVRTTSTIFGVRRLPITWDSAARRQAGQNGVGDGWQATGHHVGDL